MSDNFTQIQIHAADDLNVWIGFVGRWLSSDGLLIRYDNTLCFPAVIQPAVSWIWYKEGN